MKDKRFWACLVVTLGALAFVAQVPTFFDEVRISDGAVGDPSLTFNDDQNTGLYRIGADNVGITLGGVEYADFSTSGADFKTAITVDGSPVSGWDSSVWQLVVDQGDWFGWIQGDGALGGNLAAVVAYGDGATTYNDDQGWSWTASDTINAQSRYMFARIKVPAGITDIVGVRVSVRTTSTSDVLDLSNVSIDMDDGSSNSYAPTGWNEMNSGTANEWTNFDDTTLAAWFDSARVINVVADVRCYAGNKVQFPKIWVKWE